MTVIRQETFGWGLSKRRDVVPPRSQVLFHEIHGTLCYGGEVPNRDTLVDGRDGKTFYIGNQINEAHITETSWIEHFLGHKIEFHWEPSKPEGTTRFTIWRHLGGPASGLHEIYLELDYKTGQVREVGRDFFPEDE